MRNHFSTAALAAMLLALSSPAAAVTSTSRHRDADAPPRRRYSPPTDTALQREINEHNARVEAAKEAKRLKKVRGEGEST